MLGQLVQLATKHDDEVAAAAAAAAAAMGPQLPDVMYLEATGAETRPPFLSLFLVTIDDLSRQARDKRVALYKESSTKQNWGFAQGTSHW